MNGKTKSIILQVAAKIAADMGAFNLDQVIANYEVLVKAHTDLGIDPEEGASSNRGGGNYQRRESKAQAVTPPTFIYNGETWGDFRALKELGPNAGGVKSTFPDFRPTAGGQGTGVWITGRDGSVNPEAAALIEAADSGLNVEVL